MPKPMEAHRIDNSALIHLAVHNKWHSNVFRLECHLKSGIRPAGLQRAADAAAVRFPMLAAGIRKQGSNFVVVPTPERLNIRVDSQPLGYMSAEELRARADAEHTTLTAYFTALFAKTAMEIQKAETRPGKPLLPVQIMVPIDLRRRFPSGSCRNFSLYALPKLTPEAAEAPFSEIAENMAVQLRVQSSYSRLRSAIATNVELERRTSALPLWTKCAALRAGFEVCGGRSSCITVSNLGRVTFPEPVQQEIERLDFLLTPRIHSPYNCGIVSVGDTLSLTLTRRGAETGVEKRLLEKLGR